MSTFQSVYQPYLANGGSQSYTILGNTYTTTSTPYEIPITNYGQTYTTPEAYPVTNYSTVEYTTPIETTFNYDLWAYQTTNYANYEAISAPVYETLNVPNKKTLDTEKNKLNEDQNKFQQTKEEIQKTFISQEQISIKEESGDFLCPNCGHNLLGVIRELVEWRSRENNGTKKFVFYGIDDDFKPWWCGTMKEIYYGSYTDSGSSCGIKRHIHIKSWTKLVFKKNNSIEVCWREALTDKEWNEKLGILGCLYCDYKSNFIDFIRIKKSQAIK